MGGNSSLNSLSFSLRDTHTHTRTHTLTHSRAAVGKEVPQNVGSRGGGAALHQVSLSRWDVCNVAHDGFQLGFPLGETARGWPPPSVQANAQGHHADHQAATQHPPPGPEDTPMTVAMDTNHTHNGTAATNDSSVAAGSAPCDFIFPHQYQKSLIPSLYCIIFVLGFLGNTLVVCVLCRDAARRTVANVYLVNLALSDLLFLAGLPFWVVYYAQDYNWLFGKFMCKLCGSLLSFNIYASIYFLTCMSVDRYRAIVYPLRSQSSRSVCHARLISAFIWVMAAISSLPAVILRDTLYLPELHVTACVIHCSHPNCNAALALTKNILAFLLPFFVIATCYGCIARHLLAMPNQLEMDRGSAHLDRVLRVVVAVVMAFFLCWFPFHLLTLVQALGRLGVEMACWVEQVVETLLPFSLCLGFSNSAINPFLYCFVGNHFREQLRRLYEEKAAPRLSQKRDSFSTRLSSFSRKLSDLREPSLPEALPQPRDP